MVGQIVNMVDLVPQIHKPNFDKGFHQFAGFARVHRAKLHIDLIADSVAPALVSGLPEAFEVTPDVGHWLPEEVDQPKELRVVGQTCAGHRHDLIL